MPNHIHLIVYPQEDEHDTSRFLKRIKEPVSRRAVRFLKAESPDWLPNIQVVRGDAVEHHFWQSGRGHDRNITSSQTLQSMVDYVHLNPVRKDLVQRAADWRWSSAGWFAGRPMNDLEPDPIPWDWLENNRSPQ